MRHVPASVPKPPYAGVMAAEQYHGSHVQTPEVIEAMRLAGRIAADSILVAAAEIRPGVTTDHLDAVAEVICHGIPDGRPLEEGDLVKIDSTSYINGVHGDNCATFFVGEVSDEARLLTERTREAMYRGIKAVKPGRPLSVIGRVIQAYAKRFGYGVVREYTGHGVHTAFHSGLIVLHYDEPMLNTIMEPGMTFTIEPMLTLGSARTKQWDDGWTVVTQDGSWCAQFEQTLVVTDTGTEILTVPSSGELILGGKVPQSVTN